MSEITTPFVPLHEEKSDSSLVRILHLFPRFSAVGSLVVVALFNPFRLIAAYSTDGRLRMIVLIPVVMIDLYFIFLALVGLFKPRNSSFKACHWMTWITLFSFLIIPEAFLRLAIRLKLPQFRQPSHYASTLHPDYWKLALTWSGSYVERPSEASLPSRQDPILGWVTKESESNPLGTVSNLAYSIDYESPAILFFGDSFLRGTTKISETIPEQVRAQLKWNGTIHNFGVGGYGLDQAFLRFQDLVPRFKNRKVVFEIAMETPRRVALPFRLSPKPYFSLVDDTLKLNTENLNFTPEEYIKNIPVSFSSYWGQFLLMHTLGTPKTDLIELAKVEKITRKILKTVIETCRKENIPLAFLLLYDGGQLETEIWEEKFLNSELSSLGAQVINTKPSLLKEMKLRNLQSKDLYFADDGHPTPLGNELIGRQVSEWLSKK